MPGDDLGGELGLVGGLVREHWFARHIADTENMRHVGAHLFVDRDKAAFIDGDASSLGLELVPVGAAADRHQRIVEGVSRVRGTFERHLQAVFDRLDFGDLGFQQYLFVPFLQPFGEWTHDVAVRAGHQAVHQFDHRDF